MTFELNEADLNDAREDEYAYEKFVRNLDTITEDERAALIADLAKVAELNEKIDAIYARMIEAMTVNMRVAAPGTPQQ